MKMKRIATFAAFVALAAPSAAAAAPSSTDCAYNQQLCSNITFNHPPDGPGTLPFTGLDVALLAAGGGGLLGIGLVVRRFSSHPQA
jgi:hypothetical protein